MILYRLITADGIKSEIKEMESAPPKLVFALRDKIKITEPVEAHSLLGEGKNVEIKAREYKPVKYTTVQFVEYEEI